MVNSGRSKDRFNQGDKVVCINPGEFHLRFLRVYTVEMIEIAYNQEYPMVYLKETRHWHYESRFIKLPMSTEQTLESAENQLERDEEARECLHEYQRISVSTTEDGTQFSNCVCIHCNDQKQFEI